MSIKTVSKIEIKEQLLTVDTNVYADKDVMAADFALTISSLGGNVGAALAEVDVIDIDNIGAAIDLLFFTAAVAHPVLNVAVALTDAEWQTYIGTVKILAADYETYEDVKLATVPGLNRLLPATFYCLPVIRSASTFTTAIGAVKLVFKFSSYQ